MKTDWHPAAVVIRTNERPSHDFVDQFCNYVRRRKSIAEQSFLASVQRALYRPSCTVLHCLLQET